MCFPLSLSLLDVNTPATLHWHISQILGEVYCLWLYLEDGVLSLDQFSPHLERDLVVRVTTGVSVW